MIRIIEYETDGLLLPPFLREHLDKAKYAALKHSNERDKTFLIFDNLRFDIIQWLSAHTIKEES